MQAMGRYANPRRQARGPQPLGNQAKACRRSQARRPRRPGAGGPALQHRRRTPIETRVNFSMHAAGGAVAGGVAVGTAAILAPDSASGFVDIAGSIPREVPFLASCFTAALAMSLFPDLDTASIPQRWLSRAVLLALVAALYVGRGDAIVGMALVMALTTVHKHRGWTHWRITPWLVATVLASAREYSRAEASWLSSFSPDGVVANLALYWPLVLACVLGHYTHLLLDGALFRLPSPSRASS
jgi:hypothetical protein